MTNRFLSAREAYEWGIVNRVVSQDNLMKAASEIAEDMKTMPPLSLRAVKEAVNRGIEGYEYSRAVFSHLQSTEDAAEGYLAFSEKRKPTFKGR